MPSPSLFLKAQVVGEPDFKGDRSSLKSFGNFFWPIFGKKYATVAEAMTCSDAYKLFAKAFGKWSDIGEEGEDAMLESTDHGHTLGGYQKWDRDREFGEGWEDDLDTLEDIGGPRAADCGGEIIFEVPTGGNMDCGSIQMVLTAAGIGDDSGS